MQLIRLAGALAVAVAILAASHSDSNERRKQLEGTLHITRPLPALESKNYGKFSAAPGVDADRVSFATAYELRVPAIVYHAAGATIEKHPGLVIVNRDGGDKSSWYAYWSGILYARAGAVVLTYDPIGEFERNKERRSNTRQAEAPVEPQEQMRRRLSGLMVTDVMQAVSYLAQRKDVDAKHIAVLGSRLACDIDTGIAACVVSAADNAAEQALGTKRPQELVSDDSPVTKTIALWLEDKLKFPSWTRKQIEAMPETRIGDWAKTNHVMVSPAEAAISALGAGVLPVSRDDLHAIPEALWGADQDLYIYETWRDRALTAAHSDAP